MMNDLCIMSRDISFDDVSLPVDCIFSMSRRVDRLIRIFISNMTPLTRVVFIFLLTPPRNLDRLPVEAVYIPPSYKQFLHES